MEESHEPVHPSRFFQLLLLATAAWAATFARFALAPLQESIRGALTLSDMQIAWLQGPAVAIPMAVGAIPVGLLADRYPRAPLLFLFAGVNVIAVVLTVFSQNLLSLFVIRCLSGFALTALYVIAFSMIADLYGPAQRGRATMVVVIGEVAGAPTAFALGGYLLAASASMSLFGLEGWRSSLLLMSGVLMPVFPLMLAAKEPRRSREAHKNPPASEAIRDLWDYRGVVVPLLLARTMVWIADGGVLIWGAPHFSRRFGLSPDKVGGIMATALLISGLVAPFLGGLLADRCQRIGGPRRTVTTIAMLALSTAPTALFAVMPNILAASVLLTVFLTLSFAISPMALAVATIVVPARMRGVYVAITLAGGAIFSMGVASLVVSGLSDVLGGPSAIGTALASVCFGASVIGAAIFGFSRRYFSADSRDELSARP